MSAQPSCAFCQAIQLPRREDVFAAGIVLGSMLTDDRLDVQMRLRRGFCAKHEAEAKEFARSIQIGMGTVADA